MLIRPALHVAAEADAIWQLLEPTIRAGETQALPPDLPRAEALAYWLAPGHEVFVAEELNTPVGTYFIRPNQAGGGAHVANCAYIVAPAATGRGIAQAMCNHSMEHARSRGYLAMQFNFVVSSNERAVRLWQHLGFNIIGRSPKAFRHPSLGLVDALIMHRSL
jgi:ribosomal protein S18 acetylase RimI-like enzyme